LFLSFFLLFFLVLFLSFFSFFPYFFLQEVKCHHARWLRDNKHLRYMWIPGTDAVVVVTNNPHRAGAAPPSPRVVHAEEDRVAPLRALLRVGFEQDR
jgi:hypothetical protein